MAEHSGIAWRMWETDQRCPRCDGRLTHRAINAFASACENGHEVSDLERAKSDG